MRLTIPTGACALCCALASPATAQQLASADEQPDLSNLSIEQLAQLPVTSASKREQPLNDVPASLYVIDHDQIVRSGAVTIPQMLRLAPNLQVYQTSPSNWVVTARGLDGDPADQSFSNKLLVLIDGRTVYTPLFSGVYWDMPDLLPDDIERIEVISGPGATLWGANAVNGVINIISRSASSTSGAYASVQAGTNEQVAGLRIAGSAGQQLKYRAYLRWLHEDAFDLSDDGRADDSWHRLGGGFRVDWTPSAPDLVTFQGDAFGGREDELLGPSEDISGRDLVVRWNRDMGDGQQLQVQAFYDRIARGEVSTSPAFHIDTYDVDLQQSLRLGSRNQLVAGGGARVAHYNINGIPNFFFFTPEGRNLFLANAFVQDTFAVSSKLSVTGGLKAEHDPYVGTSLLPDIRIGYKAAPSTLLWASVSHAVRSATPFDEDVQERGEGGIISISGNRDFRTEKVTAYQLGLRSQPLSAISFSVTGYYNHYDDLRTIELGTGPGLLNLFWGNGLAGASYGVEAWGSLSIAPWWTLSAGTSLMRENFHFKPGATLPSLGTFQNGLDPDHQFTLQSSIDLGKSVTFDLDFREVGRLHHSDVPAYAELGGRLAWNISNQIALSLSGQNLLHAHHVEYAGGDEIPRAVLLGLEWRR
jgi:iron complex outermembrane receptor protein